MHILLLAQHFAPEEVSGAVLVTELATDLVKRGHQVTFVTSAPNYPQGEVFPGYRNRLYQRGILNGVTVIRTWSYISPNKSSWRRVLNHGTYSATALYGALGSKKPEVILSYSPPMFLGLTAWLLSRLWRVPWVLRVEDLYPDSAVAAGILRNRPVIRFFSACERFLYRKASHISLISDGFRQNLQNKGVALEKMSVIPVWADPDKVRPLPKDNDFRKAHGLGGQFVVMYAGNLGHASAMEDVLVAASLMRDEADIQFVIVGEGVKRRELQDFAKREGLKNVLFLPFQPREIYGQMMAAADVNLVTLNQNSSWTSMPCKTFNIMASQRPVLAVTPVESEVAQLVQESECGLNVPAGQPGQLAETIRQLKNNPQNLQSMGKNGRKILISDYSRNHCVDLFEQTLNSVKR